MSHHSHKFKIQQLQTEKLVASVESLLIFVFSLFTAILLPSLLLRYVFASQALFEPPKVLEYIPLAVFTLGIGYFVKVVWQNVMREMQIRTLTRELELLGDDCDCDHDHVDWSDPAELEKLVEEAVATTPTKTKSAKAASKTKASKAKKKAKK